MVDLLSFLTMITGKVSFSGPALSRLFTSRGSSPSQDRSLECVFGIYVVKFDNESDVISIE